MNDNRNLYGYLFAAMVMFLALQAWNHRAPEVGVDYSDFKSLLRAGQVQEVKVSGQAIKGTLAPSVAEAKIPATVRKALASADTEQPVAFITLRIQDSDLLADLERANVHYSGASDQSWTWQLIALVAPALIFVAIWMFFMKRMAGRSTGDLVGIGKSKPRSSCKRMSV